MRLTPNAQIEAQLHYLPGDFRIIKQGQYVRCAISNKRIDLEDLRYWNVERQEAYAGPDESLKSIK